MREEETGRTCRYTNHRDEKVHAELALPDQTPEWLRNLVDGRTPAQASEALWNRVEREATRANAVLAREINMALVPRQTGSSIKFFVLAAALQAGAQPSDMIDGMGEPVGAATVIGMMTEDSVPLFI